MWIILTGIVSLVTSLARPRPPRKPRNASHVRNPRLPRNASHVRNPRLPKKRSKKKLKVLSLDLKNIDSPYSNIRIYKELNYVST